MSETKWEETKEDTSEVAVNDNLIYQNLMRIRAAAASVGYIVLLFVVIYGLTDGVYQGFPKVVPYLVMLVFLAMAFVRMYQAILGVIPEKKKKKSPRYDESEDNEWEEEEEDE